MKIKKPRCSQAFSGLISFYLVLIFSALLSGCSIGEEGTVKTEVKERLNDPTSAEFRNIKVFKNGNYCGEVNAKNQMGGYVGFQPFFKVNGDLEIKKGYQLERLCYKAKDPVGARCDELMGSIELSQKAIKSQKQKIEKYSQDDSWGPVFLEVLKKNLDESEAWLKRNTDEKDKLNCK